MIRNLINLVEHNFAHAHVWHGTTREIANDLIEQGLQPSFGEFGHGFYALESPHLAGDELQEEDTDDHVVLEYKVEDDPRILDLRDDADLMLWQNSGAADHIDNPHLWKLMVKQGIDAVRNSHIICFYNPHILKFARVYSGVINDPLEETDTNVLDEIAAGGLQRCTAVTINALLKDFHLRPITLAEVPVDNPGVLRILAQHGLAYKPFLDAAGHTVQQFVNVHGLYDWYLLTPGHAMALIRGELFDAENKGPDGRKLLAAFQIMRR